MGELMVFRVLSSLFVTFLLVAPSNTQTQSFQAQEIWRTEIENSADLTINHTSITDMQISPNQDFLLVLRYDDLFVLDLSSGELETRYTLNYPSSAVRWSPSGAQVAILHPGVGIQIVNRTKNTSRLIENQFSALNQLWFVSEAHVIIYQNTDEGLEPTTINITTNTVEGFPFVSDSLYVDQVGIVWSLTDDTHVVRYNTMTSEQQIFNLNQLPLQVSPDNAWGFFHEGLTVITRYHFATGSVIPIDLGYPVEYISLLGWSPDSRYFVVNLGKITVAGTEDIVQVWDVLTMQVMFETGNFSSPVNYMHLEWRDGQVLIPNGINGQPCEITGCETSVLVVDATTGEISHILSGHHKTVNYALWAPGEDRVVTASEDGTIRMWDLTQEADYPGCDPDQALSAGEIIRFTDTQSDITGFDAPGSDTVVDVFSANQDYIIYDGPICVDGTDWYEIYPRLSEDQQHTLISDITRFWTNSDLVRTD